MFRVTHYFLTKPIAAANNSLFNIVFRVAIESWSELQVQHRRHCCMNFTTRMLTINVNQCQPALGVSLKRAVVLSFASSLRLFIWKSYRGKTSRKLLCLALGCFYLCNACFTQHKVHLWARPLSSLNLSPWIWEETLLVIKSRREWLFESCLCFTTSLGVVLVYLLEVMPLF